MPANYLILSLDGGGIRGLLTALVIQRLQAELKVLDRVKLLAGTSTGGIMALGLAGKAPIEKLVGLYQNGGETIFKPLEPGGLKGIVLNPVLDLVDGALHKIERLKALGVSSRDLVYVKYSNQGLLKLVKSVFPTEPTLKSLNPDKHVLVTTFRLDPDGAGSWHPVALHNLPTPGNDPDQTHVVEAAMCTSAAPVFFPPYRHRQLGYCVDGGVFANSPGSVALATAIAAKVDLASIRLLSIGTGHTVSRLPVPQDTLLKDPEDYGVAAWLSPSARGQTPALPIVSAFFDATSLADILVCRQLLKEGDRYRRIQVNLTQPVGLDDWKKTDQLEKIASDFFSTVAWTEHVKWVKESFV